MEPAVFFYNPNIHPASEYALRAGEVAGFCDSNKIRLIHERYDCNRWFSCTRGFEKEPEKGKRCEICFRFRLEKAALKARELNYDSFATTLTLSPHKNARLINDIGRTCGEKFGIHYLESDFKKKDGFKKSTEISRELGFYRQQYCGCTFSRNPDIKKEATP